MVLATTQIPAKHYILRMAFRWNCIHQIQFFKDHQHTNLFWWNCIHQILYSSSKLEKTFKLLPKENTMRVRATKNILSKEYFRLMLYIYAKKWLIQDKLDACVKISVSK